MKKNFLNIKKNNLLRSTALIAFLLIQLVAYVGPNFLQFSHPKVLAADGDVPNLRDFVKLSWVADNKVKVDFPKGLTVPGAGNYNLANESGAKGDFTDTDPTDGNHEYRSGVDQCGGFAIGPGRQESNQSTVYNNNGSWRIMIIFDTNKDDNKAGCSNITGDLDPPSGDIGAVRDQVYWIDRTAVKYKNDIYKVYRCDPYHPKPYDTKRFLDTDNLAALVSSTYGQGNDLIYTSGGDNKRIKADTGSGDGKASVKLDNGSQFIDLNAVEEGFKNAATDAYKLDETTILVSCGIKVENGTDLGFVEKALYKLPAQDSAEIQSHPDRKGKFFRVEGGNIYYQDWVQPGDGASAKIEADSNAPGVHFDYTITLANNGEVSTPPTELYGDKQALIDAGNKGETGSTTDNGGSGSGTPTCESENSILSLNWILCGIIGFIDNSLQAITDQVDALLDVGEDEYNLPEYKQVWSYFKNIANFLLVGAALVIIIGQAMSKE